MTTSVKAHKKEGASTLSMQLAREFWLDQSKNWKRKAAEVMITIELEQKLTKKEIFENYCNQISLGQRGSFAIRGFGQAAQAYFGKDIRQAEYSRVRHAGRNDPAAQLLTIRTAIRTRRSERRNLILSMMRQNGFITDREYAVESEAPLGVVAGGLESDRRALLRGPGERRAFAAPFRIAISKPPHIASTPRSI